MLDMTSGKGDVSKGFLVKSLLTRIRTVARVGSVGRKALSIDVLRHGFETHSLRLRIVTSPG
jgi:hypothetical protein